MLEKAIKTIVENSVKPIKVFPLFGTINPPFVTYTVTPIEGGTVKTSQVEIKAIASSMEEATNIREKIIKILDMEDNDPSLISNGIHLRSGLAGGGHLFNDSIQTWELSTIFIITWRCI